MPKISVIIPLYNKASYIKRALDSVLSQTEQNFEIIVVDDGSTDDGGKIVAACNDKRIRYCWQENKGVSFSRNKGAGMAKADLISFLDADDVYCPKFIESILRLRNQYPQAGVLSTAYIRREADGGFTSPPYAGLPNFPWDGIIPSYFESAAEFTPVCTITVAMPTKVFHALGGFPLNVTNGEDLLLWFLAATKHEFAFSSYIGAIYSRNVENANSTCSFPDDYVKTMYGALTSGTIKPTDRKFVDEMIAEQYLLWTKKYIVCAKMPLAREYAKKYFVHRMNIKSALAALLAYSPQFMVRQLLYFRERFGFKL